MEGGKWRRHDVRLSDAKSEIADHEQAAIRRPNAAAA